MIAAWYGPHRESRSDPIDWSAEVPEVPDPDLGDELYALLNPLVPKD